MFTLFQVVRAQTRTIAGRVTDQKTGEGLPGATVLLKGTTTGVSSNSDGRFNLDVPAAGGTLVISSVGMVTQEVALGSRNNIDVALATDNRELSEVVVTGYGEQVSRRELTGAVATVNSAQYKDQPVLGVDQALQGRAAGVQVYQNSGTPGSGIQVRVRGASSITASNEPLYVVDGLPINTGSYTQLGSGNQQTNALNDLNPNDIASIEVLKDASQAAVYGSRGSNGVVIITTKRGKSGKAQIDLDYYQGLQQVWRRPEVLNGTQQTQLFLDATANRYPGNANGTVAALGVTWRSNADLAGYLYGPGTSTSANGIYSYVNSTTTSLRPLSQFQDPTTAPNTNWTDLVLRTAPISNYGVTFSGGSDASRYRLALNYFDQQGTIIGSGFNRGSARFTMDNKLSDKVRMGTSIGLSRVVNNRINNDNSIYGVLTASRLTASDIPVYNPDGSYVKYGSVENPVAAANEPYIVSAQNRLIGTQYTEFEFIKNLKYRATFGLDFIYGRDDRFYNTLTNAGVGVRGQGEVATAQDANFNHISQLNYNKTFGADHSLNALFVAEYQRDWYSDTYEAATNFPGNTIRQLAAGATKTAATSSATGWALFGLLAKADYAYKGRYLLGASVRRDYSTRFGANRPVGYFPSVSAGWRVSDEAFLKDQSAISELKIRASYGQTGNQFIGNFVSRGLIGVGYNYLDQGGLVLNQLENRDLTWERGNSIDLGLDLGSIQNRIYLSLDLYYRKTTDLLQSLNLSNDTGLFNTSTGANASYTANVGSMENKGLEIALTTINLQNDNGGFSWTTNFNITFNRNKVLVLADQSATGVPSGFASRIKVGEPLGAFYGYRVDHIFQTQDEINTLNSAASTGAYQVAATRPGDIKFKDLNGDGVITAADQEIIGNAQPKYYGGITNTLGYKGFSLNFLAQFNVGNQVYNYARAYTQGMGGTYGQDAAVLNRWTPTNTNTDIPRAVYGDPNSNARTSDRFLEDGSYLRLKTVTLGYNLPSSLLSRVHLRTARVYVQSQNLVTFTHYSGLDPRSEYIQWLEHLVRHRLLRVSAGPHLHGWHKPGLLIHLSTLQPLCILLFVNGQCVRRCC